MAAWMHGEAGRRAGAGLIAEDLEQQLPGIFSALHAGAP
jgi:NAD(P)H-hydrate repair Nnr-like enzyme with NAD(P)H-hydrate dehydratase domain